MDKNRRVWLVHLAPPCTFWSQALAGRSQHHQQTGLSTAEVTLKIMRACDRANVLWTLENPKSSRLWNWPPLSEYLTMHGLYIAEVHYCQFKCSYQKATYFAGSFPEVMQLQRLCVCFHGHELRTTRYRTRAATRALGDSLEDEARRSLPRAVLPALCSSCGIHRSPVRMEPPGWR